MENTNATGVKGAMSNSEQTVPRTKSHFLLVAGGLLVFWAAESILSTAGLWSKVASDYAGGVVLGLLGAIVLYHAVKR